MTSTKKEPASKAFKKALLDFKNDSCTCANFKDFIHSVIPATQWIPAYNVRKNLIKDIISGITVCFLQIPQGITYGNLLAGQSPKYGLFTSMLPPLIYMAFGTSRHISIGTYAVLCLLIGEASSNIHPDLTLNATAAEWEDLYALRIVDVSSMTFYISIIMFCGSLVNAGYIMKYLSIPMMSGFTAGAACHVFSSQVSTLFGLNIPRQRGPGKLVKLYIEIVKGLTKLNKDNRMRTVTSTVMGVLLIIFLVVVRKINEKYRKKYFKGIPIPGELLVLIIGTVVTYLTKFNDSVGLSIVGEIPNGLPKPVLPDFSKFGALLPDMIPILVIGYASHMATSKIIAIKHDYEEALRPNQELLALAFANLVGSFFTCLPSVGSIARSCVQDESGGKTQVASVVSGILLIVVLLVAASLFYYTPKVSLSVIVLVSVISMIKKFNDFIKYMKVDRIDAAVWMIAFLSTVFIDVTFGLIISVVGQLLSIVLRTQFDGVTARRMHVQEFPEIEENNEDVEVFDENSTTTPKYTPVISDSPKAIRFSTSPPKTRAFSITEQPKQKRPKFAMKTANTYIQDAIMIVSWNAPLHYLNREAFRYGVIKKTGGLNPRQLDEQVGEDNKTLETSNMSDPDTFETSASVKEVALDVKSASSGKVLILELNVPFSDFTGVQELAEMVRDYRKGGVKVFLANVSPGLKLAIENLVKHNLVNAFSDSEDGEAQLDAFRSEFLCENVQAAVNRARN